jgi:carbon monoxide dehydrogenase subunit G
MMRLSDSVCVDAPVEATWAALSQLDTIHHWGASIRRSACVTERTRGVDAVRVCELAGNLRVTETMVAWEEGRSLTYDGAGIPLVTRARNRWTVEPRGDQTLVTSYAEVQLRGGPVGRLLEPLIRLVSKRMGRSSLAAFKYWVEQGKPYAGKARHRLPLPTAC